MENFILYEQLTKSDTGIIYKGRKKGTISFLAMKCAEKQKKGEIANMVRLIHEIKHDNIVRFYEWYETSEHLWLMFELCTGGTLEVVIQQDLNLPEKSIRFFGIDIVEGLHHIHSLGIICCDLQPSKILLCGNGHLKLADFSYSRLESENLEEVLRSFSDGDLTSEQQKSKHEEPPLFPDIPDWLRTSGNPRYMSPEVMSKGLHSYASDFWSLGCILFELFTGYPPFLAETFAQLKEKALNREMPTPKVVHGCTSELASEELQDLLRGLLQKQPDTRLQWSDLLVHSFWQDAFFHHLQLQDCSSSEQGGLVLTQSQETLKQSVRQSIAGFRVMKEQEKKIVADGIVNDVKVGFSKFQDGPAQSDGDDDDDDDKEMTLKESTIELKDGENYSLREYDDMSGRSTGHEEIKLPDNVVNIGTLKLTEGCGGDVSKLLFHPSDFQATPIHSSKKGSEKMSSFKFDPNALSFTPASMENLDSASMDSHVQTVHSCLVSNLAYKTGPPPHKLVQLINYIGSFTFKNSSASNRLVSLKILSSLAKHSKDTSHVELKLKLCQIINTIAISTTRLSPDLDLSESLSNLVSAARENLRNQKLKTSYLSTIGELLCLIVREENSEETPGSAWLVPPTVYSFINKCLTEGEDIVCNLYSSRIIANVSIYPGHHTQRFLTAETCSNLWSMFLHNSSEFIKLSAITALCRLSRFNLAFSVNLFEKFGLFQYLAVITSTSHVKLQQHGITLLVMLLMSDLKPAKWLQDKDLLASLMKLLESSSSYVLRAKLYLGIIEIVRSSNEQLLCACQNRLLTLVEKDSKRSSPGETPKGFNYMKDCLRVSTDSLLDVLPSVFSGVLSSLEMISGRKHLNHGQQKQLKVSLSMLQIVQHFINSSMFRLKIISKTFLRSLSKLYEVLVLVDSSVLQLPIVLGASNYEEFILTIFGCSEFIVQQGSVVVDDHVDIIINNILSHLFSLVTRSSGELRSMSLRLFCEISGMYLSLSSEKTLSKSQAKCLDRILEGFLPHFEPILLEPEPTSSLVLRLLHQIIEHRPNFIKNIEQANLSAVLFQIVYDHQNSLLCSPVEQVVLIMKCIVSRRETDFKLLFQLGFSDFFNFLFTETTQRCSPCKQPSQSCSDVDGKEIVIISDSLEPFNQLLSELLDLFHLLMKRVSEVVRGALEAKKVGQKTPADAAEAKNLLSLNKAFIPLISHLTQLLVHKDEEISEESLKCLGLLIQFYGGENQDSLSLENQRCYNEYLQTADIKKQKIVLRLVKRLMSTKIENITAMSEAGSKLLATIKNIAEDSRTTSDPGLVSVAKEIIQFVKKPT